MTSVIVHYLTEKRAEWKRESLEQSLIANVLFEYISMCFNFRKKFSARNLFVRVLGEGLSESSTNSLQNLNVK